jgi:drug/metabolite transporter (DMT)-like permease
MSLLLGATLWGVFWYPLRVLEENGVSGLWFSLIAYLGVAVLSLPLLWRRRAELIHRPGLLLLLALTAGWCNVAFIVAVIEGQVMRVLLLFYLTPLWAALLGWWLLGERLSRAAGWIFLLALTGAFLMLWNPQGELLAHGSALLWTRADWLAISAGFSFALSNVLVRKAQDTSVPVKTIAVWWGGAVLAGAWLLLSHAALPEVQLTTVAWTGILGCVGIIVMTLAVQYGVTHMPVHRSAVILLFELVAGAVSAQLLTNEVMSVWEWAGGVLIMCAAYLSVRRTVPT